MQIKGTKLIIKGKPTEKLLTWLPALFYLANLYRMTDHSALPYLAMLAGCGAAGLFLLAMRRITRREVLYAAMLLFVLTGLANALTVGNADIREIGSDILYMGITIVMFAYPMNYAQSLVTFYALITPFVIGWITGAGTHFFLTSSGNYISVLILLAASLYYIPMQISDRRFRLIDILPACICFVLSVWAKGRAGILCCLLLLGMISAYYVSRYRRKGNYRLLIFLLIALTALAWILISNISLITSFLSLGKWSYRGFDTTARQVIWGSYVEKLEERLLYVLNGAPLDDIVIIHAYNNNTHNSFLQLHATNGLVPFVLALVLTAWGLFYYVRRKKLLFAIVLLIIFIRSLSDTFVFGKFGMPIVMYLLLYPFFDRYVQGRAPKSFGTRSAGSLRRGRQRQETAPEIVTRESQNAGPAGSIKREDIENLRFDML